MRLRDLFRRWAAFNTVGAAGVILQLAVLGLLVYAAELHYGWATLLAVETTILHNYFWHQRWTWRDRRTTSGVAAVTRFAKFNAINGGISLAGNTAVMGLLAGGAGVEPVAANAIAIAICSLANFGASELLVFRSAAVGAAILAVAAPAWAGQGAETVHDWQAYTARVDARLAEASGGGAFFALDTVAHDAGWRAALRNRSVIMSEIEAPSVRGGKMHHWIGAVFVPSARLDDVVGRLQRHAGDEARFYEDVLASRLVSRSGDRAVVFMKLRRDSIITVTYNTEHEVEYRRLAAGRVTSRSVARRIAELADAGTPQEREKPPGSDRGFLWRLNAYWRYEQVDGGVLIECESVSLSRGIPLLLRPLVTSTVDRIARESLERTLRSLRAFLAAPLPVAAAR